METIVNKHSEMEYCNGYRPIQIKNFKKSNLLFRGLNVGVAKPRKVGMLHGASDDKTLIANGCTSVHPYNIDRNWGLNTPSNTN